MTRLPYYPQLDSLRFLAMFTVFVQHFYEGSPAAWGYYGLRVFFVLSGFLITNILISHRDRMHAAGGSVLTVAKNFYIRRALRLFPAYYLALAIIIAISLSLGVNYKNILTEWPWHFAYMTNVLILVKNDWIGNFTHLWSLALEEQFYLVWVWVVLLSSHRILPWITSTMIAGGLAFQFWIITQPNTVFLDLQLPNCIYFLATGALLGIGTHPAYAKQMAPLVKLLADNRRLVGAGVLLAAVVAIGVDLNTPMAEFPKTTWLFGPCAAIMAVWAVWRISRGVGGWVGSLLSAPWLIYLGKISYGSYIFHAFTPELGRPVLRVIRGAIGNDALAAMVMPHVRFVVLCAITLTLAALSWKLIEQPFNAMKTRYSEGIGSNV